MARERLLFTGKVVQNCCINNRNLFNSLYDTMVMDERQRIRQEKMEKLQNEANMPRKPIKVTDGNFEDTLRDYDAVVVDLWASWCMPCKMIEPAVEALAEKMAGKVVFAKLNVDENPRTAARYQVMSIPTLLVFKKGSPVKRIVGAVPQQHLEQQITEAL